MKGSRLCFLLSLVLTILAPGCHKEALELTPDIASSDEALYRLGEIASKKDAEKAVLYLRQVIDSFPKSFYAQRAKLLIADIYFRKGDENHMILAAAEYREFIRSYPYSPSAAYCQYQIAMTFFKKMPKPGRDPAKTIQALAEFKKIIDDYPVSDQAKPSREKIRECEERLASHNAEIGIFYHNRKAYRAAISRLTEVMTIYPEYSGLGQVYYYLAESYYQMKQYDQALPFFSKVVTDYAGLKMAKAATRKLAEIERIDKDAAKKSGHWLTPPAPRDIKIDKH